MVLCRCGCNREVSSKGGWVIGHWMKGRPSVNKGNAASPKTRELQRLAKLGKPRGTKNRPPPLKLAGQPCICGCGLSAETDTGWVTGHWNNGKKHPNRVSRPLSAETRTRQSDAQRRRWATVPRKVVVPKPCACGCGTVVNGTWAQGHHVRVNNPSSSPEVKEKRRANFVRMHAEGAFPVPWNRGKTKEDDPRIAEYAKKISGSNCSFWKGGVTPIYTMVHGLLYRPWKRPILARDGFRCRACGGAECELNVHHDEERFQTIFDRIVPKDRRDEITWEEKERLAEEVVRYHVENDVSGITLCRDCHSEAHRLSDDSD